ncbi:hypothetical protein E4U43_005210, partial [Claviceps pusilla]
MALPSREPAYRPTKIVTGHFCHSRSQSSGMGTAPSHEPSTAPAKAPKVSSKGAEALTTASHACPSLPLV